MEGIVFKAFGVLFQVVGVLLSLGIMCLVLSDIQKRAFDSKQVGLTSMLKINQQLVGKTK